MAAKLNYTFAADALATKAGVPPALVSALINAESAWNPAAVSSTGCTGLGQFCLATAKDYGLVGDGFDNRADAALNLTAMVKYLADLRKANDSWREAIRHYSGQSAALEGYARYSAGQALVATIDMIDGVTTAPTPSEPGEGPTIIVESITGREQSTGRPARFIASVGGVALLALIGGSIVACCSPDSVSPARQQIAEAPIPPAGFDFSGSTFVLKTGNDGRLLAAPLGK
jgi:hypothetical protein